MMWAKQPLSHPQCGQLGSSLRPASAILACDQRAPLTAALAVRLAPQLSLPRRCRVLSAAWVPTPPSSPAASDRVATVDAQAARRASSLALERTQAGLTSLRSKTLPVVSTPSAQLRASQPIWGRW